MALNKSDLKAALLAAMNNASEGKTKDDIAQEWADAIDAYVRDGQVVIPGGSSAGTYPVT